jgi:FkbM family methyltransferase
MMDRRTLLSRFTGGISSSFLLGTSGGIAVGAAGTAIGIQRSRPSWCKQSYSQQGEDLIVESIFESLGTRNPSYLDIGAADPIRINNTYLFYRKGCRGVLVEPNPAYCRKLKVERPRDKVLNVGVGFTGDKEADYYMIGGADDSADLNTFSKKQAESYSAKTNGEGFVEKVIKMPMVNINVMMQENFGGAPSFLSIDTEGVDFDILGSLDFDRFRPSVVCVETLVFGTRRVEAKILDLMQSKDYIVRGGTFVNTIFVDNRLLKSLG